MRLVVRVLGIVVGVFVVVVLGIKLWFGGGKRLADRTTEPLKPSSELELVANLEYPPGNIAVSWDGRIFFTYHPDGDPPAQVLELVGGKPVPFPNAEFQKAAAGKPYFQSVLALRVDARNWLWALDYANYGTGQPRLLAFDLRTNQLVQQYDFPSDVAGFLSMLNDFQIDGVPQKIYIADASPIRQTPAIVVYDSVKRTSRRLLEGHPSVQAGDYIIQAPGRDMIAYGLYALKIGIDSIVLDKRDEWLYYGSVTGDRMYRIATKDLNDESLSPEALGAKVEDFAPKTLSDGLSIDVIDDIYLGDMEHSAILKLDKNRTLTTLLKDPRLRWPDGFSFGPNSWLYITCSSLQDVLFISRAHMHAHAPYQIFRFLPGQIAMPGQ